MDETQYEFIYSYEDIAKTFRDFLDKQSMKYDFKKEKDEFGETQYVFRLEFENKEDLDKLLSDIVNRLYEEDEKRKQDNLQSSTTINQADASSIMILVYEACTDVANSFANEVNAKIFVNDTFLLHFEYEDNKMMNKYLNRWFDFIYDPTKVTEKDKTEIEDVKYMILEELKRVLKSRIVDGLEYTFKFTDASCIITQQR